VGGNLSILYSLNGSVTFPDCQGKILFIEDLDEYLYHIDRMMINLKRSGTLAGLSGLIVGGMTDMNDNDVPFGKSAKEIIKSAVSAYGYPVCFDFPAGHIDDNCPLIFGRNVLLEVSSDTAHISF
jgi:muramoyltetrapeptide carboxypeptidase